MSKIITIVLADDHPIVRQGLRTVLEGQAGYQVIGEAEDGLAALALTEQLKPQVLIVDLMMPGLNGLEVTRRVRKQQPETQVVVLSMQGSEPYVLEALRSGASAYVLKATSTSSLLEAVQAAVKGQRYLSPPLTERAIEAYLQKAAEASSQPDGYKLLTTREREVFQLAAEGLTNPQIAERLSISVRTAETHRTNLMRKLGLHTETELVRYAIGRGIIQKEG
jgi:DNA-binding NarL/FixJ family response regulator